MDVWGVWDNGSGWWWVVVETVIDESGEIIQFVDRVERCRVDDGVGWSAWGGGVVVWGVCEDIEGLWAVKLF